MGERYPRRCRLSPGRRNQCQAVLGSTRAYFARSCFLDTAPSVVKCCRRNSNPCLVTVVFSPSLTWRCTLGGIDAIDEIKNTNAEGSHSDGLVGPSAPL